MCEMELLSLDYFESHPPPWAIIDQNSPLQDGIILRASEKLSQYFENDFLHVQESVGILRGWIFLMKEEGNALLEDKEFSKAYNMFSYSIMAFQCLLRKTRNPAYVDLDLMATISINRALCLLKMDYACRSLDDFHAAISMNPVYYEAYYHMAKAWKRLDYYEEAKIWAARGVTVFEKMPASAGKRQKWRKDFLFLLLELEKHMSAEKSTRPNPFELASTTGEYDFSELMLTVTTPEREQRQSNIKQFLSGYMIPDDEMLKDFRTKNLHMIFSDLQAEADLCLKEKNYKMADQLYFNLLVVAKLVQQSESIDCECISNIFCRRAECRLKLEHYEDALKDCNSAIDFHKHNLEARAKKAMVLKLQNKFGLSLKIAEECEHMAKISKAIDVVRICEDLIIDNKCQISILQDSTTTAGASSQVASLNSGSSNKASSEAISTSTVTSSETTNPKITSKKASSEAALPKITPSAEDSSKTASVSTSFANGDFSTEIDSCTAGEENNSSVESTMKLSEPELNLKSKKKRKRIKKKKVSIPSDTLTEAEIISQEIVDMMKIDPKENLETNKYVAPESDSVVLHNDIEKVYDRTSFAEKYTGEKLIDSSGEANENVCCEGNSEEKMFTSAENKNEMFGYEFQEVNNGTEIVENAEKGLLEPSVHILLGQNNLSDMKTIQRGQTFHEQLNIPSEKKETEETKDSSMQKSNSKIKNKLFDKAKRPIKQIFCIDCNVSVNSEKSMDHHNRSKSHINKIKAKKQDKVFLHIANDQKEEKYKLSLSGSSPQVVSSHCQVVPAISKESRFFRADHKNPEASITRTWEKESTESMRDIYQPRGISTNLNSVGIQMFSMKDKEPTNNLRTSSSNTPHVPQPLHPEAPKSLKNSSISFKTDYAIQPSFLNEPCTNEVSPLPPDFPMSELYGFKLVCSQCFIHGKPVKKKHVCSQKIFLLQNKVNKEWIMVRERINHQEFRGSYQMCEHFGTTEGCNRKNYCTFAHNEEELKLWGFEKNGTFELSDFIAKNRTTCTNVTIGLKAVIAKYPGYLQFLCRECLREHKRISVKRENANYCSNFENPHLWKEHRILVHRDTMKRVTPIASQNFSSTENQELCKMKLFCNEVNCSYAHSELERDIWNVQRTCGLSEDQLMMQSAKIGIGLLIEIRHQIPKSSQVQIRPPYDVCKACGPCWKKTRRPCNPKGSSDVCDSSAKHDWKTNAIYIMMKPNKQLKELPKHIPLNNKFVICWQFENSNNCPKGNNCQFAHSKEEIDVWNWMLENKVKNIDQVMQLTDSKNTIKTATVFPSSPFSGSAWSVPVHQTNDQSLLDPNADNYYCQYCGICCNSRVQLEDHYTTEKHKANVNSDKDHHWSFRLPPLNVSNGDYKICEKHVNGDKCRYSKTQNNFCTNAHSEAELDEWKVRYKYHQMRKGHALQERLFSYMNQIIRDYENAESGLTVMTECLNNVEIRCLSNLSWSSDNKTEEHIWQFTIESNKKLVLEKVALLYEENRLHFTLHISKESEEELQLAEGIKFWSRESDGKTVYTVFVKFVGGMFGSFSQTVVFDFGTRPVLIQKLNVEIGSVWRQKKLQHLRNKFVLNRWTSHNREIVKFCSVDEFNDKLLKLYEMPSSQSEVITQQVIGKELNQNNYVHKMHGLLYLEELMQTKIISQYNIQTKIQLTNVIEDAFGGNQWSSNGQLFADVPLNSNLLEGSLMLHAVNKVLLAPIHGSQKVYEADIPHLDGINARKSDSIYITLSKQFCQDFGLQHDTEMEVEMQFQLDRASFCRMHYAVDQLRNTEIVFPDPSKLSLPIKDMKSINYIIDSRLKSLNENQNKIVEYVSVCRHHFPPPMVVYGPFGTGKTETLAQAAIILATQNKDARILICTKSNLTADEYIGRHFDQYITKYGYEKLSVLRIYSKIRMINRVSQITRKYCLPLTESRDGFIQPTADVIREKQIIVTTLDTSITLTTLEIQDFFTHIFIDEASQDYECRTIMPLSLANEKTCIVFAGDHIQMVEQVYSRDAMDQKFHYSIVERLMYHYDKYSNTPSFLPKVFLTENYRNHREIVSFIAKIFYAEENSLTAKSAQQDVKDRAPMAFYACSGHEEQENRSSSIYNQSEVDEIVEQVNHLYENWPKEWNERNLKEVLVTTPYTDQVNRIRHALRNRHLGQVTVIRVQNVPGLEFRAVFISTVRTKHLQEEKKSCSEFVDDDASLGFLSQPKMLNSAFTRAKSFLAVVGDPIALCTFGECSNIWMEYLKQCEKMNSIYPETWNLEKIKSNCEAFTNLVDEEECIIDDKERRSNLVKLIDWNTEYSLEPDEILRQLKEQSFASSPYLDNFYLTKHTQLDQIKLREKDGRAFFDCRKYRRSSTSSVMSDDFNNDSETDITGIQQEFAVDKLRELTVNQSQKYKRCRIHIDGAVKMHAIPLDLPITFKKILLTSRKRCGRSFHSDEVVVEILRESETVDRVPTKIAYGQVIGIIKHAINPKFRLFVCQVEEGNTGMMVPLNKGVPKMHNLDRKRGEPKNKNAVTVYKFTSGKDINFDRYEPINPFNQSSKLFVVRFLKWEQGFTYPLGIVVNVLEPGNTFDKAMDILNIEHNIPSKYISKAIIELNDMYPSEGYSIPATAFQGRTDYRKKLVFTIDPDESMDLDDALSLEKLADGQFLIGIHISDVSYFVKKESNIDEEARKRGTSFYPATGKPIHMLPEHLSTNLCSLLPGQDRLTISLFITVDSYGKVIGGKAVKSVINSKFRLSYTEVESILVGLPISSAKQFPEQLKTAVIYLSTIAQIQRKRRLGMAALYHSFDIESQDSPRAHSLVEEFMITANQRVAMKLMEKYPLTTPLRSQLPPNEIEVEEWRERFREEASNTVGLTKAFKPRGEICKCSSMCACIPMPNVALNENHPTMDIIRSVWKDIRKAAEDDDLNTLRSLVVNPELHPQLSVALLLWWQLQDKSQYVCSGSVPRAEQGHFSLNIQAYTHFTSPIRRYIDLVVHRLLSAVISDQSTASYSQDEISEICSDCTDAAIRSKKYEEATKTAQLCHLLQEQPLVINPVVSEVDSKNIKLNIVALRSLFKSNIKVEACSLNLADKPVIKQNNILLEWSQRIYDVKPKIFSKTLEKVTLNPDRFIFKTSSPSWKELLNAVKDKNFTEFLNPVLNIQSSLTNRDKKFVEELTSEGVLIERKKHFCKYSLELHTGSVVKVQLSAEVVRGLLSPHVQMLSLTPLACVCTEHGSDPVNCFANRDAKSADRNKYPSIKQYQDLWLPVLAMESAHGCVLDGVTAIVHNINITWKEEKINGKKSYVGFFNIPHKFCKERFIHQFLIDKQEVDLEDYLEVENESFTVRCFGYICVRYPNLQSKATNTNLPLDRAMDRDQPFTWVGHCTTSKATVIKKKHKLTGKTDEISDEDDLKVFIELNQSSSPLPRQLITPSTMATIEWIPKTLPHRRMTVAVTCLTESSMLAQSIAKGQNPPPLDNGYLSVAAEFEKIRLPNLIEPNQVQQNAIRSALTSSFRLIQGPPGTGKTQVAVRLAYLFSQINKKLPPSFDGEENHVRPQVMCCGPSNKAVDVVAGYLNRLKIPARLVRVYSEKKEQEEFPLPRRLCLIKKQFKLVDKVRDAELDDILLHHMIRKENFYSGANKICDMDVRIRKMIERDAIREKLGQPFGHPNDVREEEVEEYRNMIAVAEREVLRKSDIILVTCSASGAPRMKHGCNVQQLIIDECGMCMEPESLIPIVRCSAKQVVLVGDHQQLQPVVLEKGAARRGLGRSLFERYATDAVMLTIQYRMHEAIAKFPSETFYKGELKPGRPGEQCKPSLLKFWPGGGSKPIAFVHLHGEEESQPVATEEGGVLSRSNVKEKDFAVNVAIAMMKYTGIRAQDIAILSQYRVQCAIISKELTQRGGNLKDITVQTVVSSQGAEWDYVILSTVRSMSDDKIDKSPSQDWKRRNLGFITDHHQINVALTRARKGLIIIGNKNLLACDDMWKSLLKHYKENNAVIDAREFRIHRAT